MKAYLPKILMWIASLSLLVLFLFPIWKITLKAPQYPDGISMYIWINQITGDSEYTLQNINILNHYVGMKYIEPDSIPELTYFPYIIVGLCVLGLVFSFLKNNRFYLVYSLILIMVCVLGLYDFYLWEYDYGHNLSDTAPIKVPGMAYQPPVFGSKMLLNFEAISYPHTGALFMGISIVLSFLSFFIGKKKKAQKTFA